MTSPEPLGHSSPGGLFPAWLQQQHRHSAALHVSHRALQQQHAANDVLGHRNRLLMLQELWHGVRDRLTPAGAWQRLGLSSSVCAN